MVVMAATVSNGVSASRVTQEGLREWELIIWSVSDQRKENRKPQNCTENRVCLRKYVYTLAKMCKLLSCLSPPPPSPLPPLKFFS